MGKQIIFRITIIAVIVSLIGAACQSEDANQSSFVCEDALGCVTIAPNDPIIIASIQNLTGGAAPIGLSQDRSLRMAIADRNNQLLGHPLVVQSEDDGCTQEGGANAALRVVANPQIVGVLGTACSAAASGAVPIVSQAGWVMISGANTAPSLTSVDGQRGNEWYPGYFRTIYNGDVMGLAGARFALSHLGVARAATVNDGDLYSRGVASSFETAFIRLGGTITLSLTINKGDQDLQPALQAIATSEPELIYMPIFQPEADFLMAQALSQFPQGDMVFLGTESLLVDDFLRQLSFPVTMYFTTATVLTNQDIARLVERYQALYVEYPHSGFHYAYDAAGLLLYGIEKIAVQDEDGTLHIGRQALRDTLYGVRGYEGMTGTLNCDTFGDCNRATFYVVRVADPSAGLAGVLSDIVASYQTE